MSGRQVYLPDWSRWKYHFAKAGWDEVARCSVRAGLDLSTAVDPENVAVDERCQRDGCRQQWDETRGDPPSDDFNATELRRLARLLNLIDALGETPTDASGQDSLARVAALDDRTVQDTVRMIRRARGIQ